MLVGAGNDGNNISGEHVLCGAGNDGNNISGSMCWVALVMTVTISHFLLSSL